MVTSQELNSWSVGTLPGLIGVEILTVEKGQVASRLPIRAELLAPNGFLHAASVIALADTACGYGVMASLPDGALGFTTIELKSNFLGTSRDGIIHCDAKLIHSGRTTQVWDASVINEGNQQTIALFRCTQLILYPRAK